MLNIATALKRIRTRLHDTDAITYDDDEIVDAINCGLRFIRRAIADFQPELLMQTMHGELQPGEYRVAFARAPTALIRVTAGDEVQETIISYHSDKIWHNYNKIWHNHTKICSRTETTVYREHELHSSNVMRIRDFSETGEPCSFYRAGMTEIRLWPVPETVTAYTVLYVDDIDEVDASGVSPLSTEFDDFLIEYAATRLSVGNEFDMSQEQQIMANIYGQIQSLLRPLPPGVDTVGYWDDRGNCCVRGYGRRDY